VPEVELLGQHFFRILWSAMPMISMLQLSSSAIISAKVLIGHLLRSRTENSQQNFAGTEES